MREEKNEKEKIRENDKERKGDGFPSGAMHEKETKSER